MKDNPSKEPANRRPFTGVANRNEALHRLLAESALDELERNLQNPLQLASVDLGGIITRYGALLSAMSSELGISLHIRIREGCVPVRADLEKIRRTIAALIIQLLTLAQTQACVTAVVERSDRKNKPGMSLRLSADQVAVPWKPESEAEEGKGGPDEVSVCRRLVEMNGGSLTMQSEGESGISYLLWLPIKGRGGR